MKTATKNKELIVLAKEGCWELACRREYWVGSEGNPKVWGGLDYIFEGEAYCVRIGWLHRGNEEEMLRQLREWAPQNMGDERGRGWYCIYCHRFSKKPVMKGWKARAVKLDNGTWALVNDHYDGCEGWD